jgi:GNAT superfamily N-acetyltransferase
MIEVRPARADDMAALAALIDEYMRETFRRAFGGSAEALARDAAADLDLLVAAEGPTLLGFAAVAPCYDLHHCMRGAELLDIFVRPGTRGEGIAARLVMAAAGTAQRRGARFLRGQAVGATRRSGFYTRVGVVQPGDEVVVSGRAFRKLAELDGRSAREILGSLPPLEWNHEP